MSKGRIAVGATVVLAVGGAVVAATGFGFGSPREEPPRASPSATAKVTRQTLVDTRKEKGSLGYGDKTAISGRLQGTVTGLPAVGSVVQRGHALCQVDNTPVVLLYGSLPAYRALSVGTEGADVKQFEENLAALGYKGFTVDDEYSSATATAVKKWQDALALAETGVVELGRVHYAPGSIRMDTAKTAVGDELRPGGELLEYTGSARVVTVDLDLADQAIAVKGTAVTVGLPGGKSLQGKVAATATVVDEGNGPDAQPSTELRVTITPDDEAALTGLDQASVDVGFVASRRENVLTVPVGALLALAEGGYGVEVVDGGTGRVVAVETGLFAAGRVEVTGVGEGQTVGVPA
ncbi:peptidoglycan-binding protein [Actinokineospora diospyrosa]|uniref:Peptidoglycan binding domain-containing protein n=1 Tax=Actinokineospora diospyrosa TaxID=103728 RepID=A0ABT1IFM4_9PSEU|nr:peptidoglycan-binding protein [Actinokineospora diospyrosa]MCP2271447.1 putative peptidoglycan binding domain-containing protein [Actinokineospora diospyrosa]